MSVVDLANLAPGKPVTVIIHKASGDVIRFKPITA